MVSYSGLGCLSKKLHWLPKSSDILDLATHGIALQAAWAAIQVYLELHQKPAAVSHADDDLANSGLSAEELKKLKLKRKKVRQPSQSHLHHLALVVNRHTPPLFPTELPKQAVLGSQ